MNKITITRDNYKKFGWNENVKYQYRGLIIKCDHEADTGFNFYIKNKREKRKVLK